MNLMWQRCFREMPHGNENDPSIESFIGKANTDEVENICAYLNAGIPLVTCCGVSFDVIKPEKGIAGTPAMLTDGKRVWPGDLSYYVRNYLLALDPAFIADMHKNTWKVDLPESTLDIQDITIDGVKLFE